MPTPLLIDSNDRPDEVWADPVRGRFRWRTLLSSDVTASDTFTAGIMSLEAGEHWAVHRHAEAELYFGLAGEADVEVDGKIYRLKPETLLYIPGNVFHGIPTTSASLRLFYTFASDSFDTIKYTFRDEQ
ncbi:cupin domain-containing protein [Methylorubrum sp. POS3]|uniref:cupin domain-containing protein n=1 Tax=Methylorubrum sp. POS3 TaxID=2998492 RepID=UPI00372B64EA